jgi:hypothetical protein
MTDSWQCVGQSSYYELCAAGKSEQCQAMDCEEISRNGLCSLPSLRRYDMERKFVVQFCSVECGCDTPSEEEIRRAQQLQSLDSSVIVSDDYACCSLDQS